jgi:hypothetical protein
MLTFFQLNQSLDFVRDMIGSTDTTDFKCSDGNQPMMQDNSKKKIVSVVGASYSSVSVQVTLKS